MSYYLPRSDWGPGPWENEPDEETFEAHGLECRVRRNQAGALCGYVILPVLHPLHGVDGNQEIDVLRPLISKREARPIGEEPGLSVMLAALSGQGLAPRINHVLEVHGGVSWTGFFRGETAWRVGFDCAHSGDLSPAVPARDRFGGVYRDIAYVRAQCTKLAAQLAEVTIPEVN